MFGRYLGYYKFKDLVDMVFPSAGSQEEFKNYLPKKNLYYFSMCREALFTALYNRRLASGKKYVAIPAWGCPIVAAVVHRSGFTPLLLDISPSSLHIATCELLQLSQSYDIDSVILIAENGIPYSSSEVETLHKNRINVISDFAIGWQNLDSRTVELSDYEIFSGGFSKPVSGFGFGVLSTNNEVVVPQKAEKVNESIMFLKVFAHLVLQQQYLYHMIQPFINVETEAEYDGTIRDASVRTVNMVMKSLKRVENRRNEWLALQYEIYKIFMERGVESPLMNYPDSLQTKISFNKNHLLDRKKHKIEYHQQYKYNLLNDPRCVKVDSNYEGLKRLREDYLSFALNREVIYNNKNFLESLNSEIK